MNPQNEEETKQKFAVKDGPQANVLLLLWSSSFWWSLLYCGSHINDILILLLIIFYNNHIIQNTMNKLTLSLNNQDLM